MRLIDADELKIDYGFTYSDITPTHEEMYALIDRQKTVESVRKGHWIRHPEQKNIYGGKCVECSECGEKYVVQYIEDEKFCRNCGADMRGE